MAKDRSMIYVIDDDASVRKALGWFSRSANLDAETFSSAEEVLCSLRLKARERDKKKWADANRVRPAKPEWIRCVYGQEN